MVSATDSPEGLSPVSSPTSPTLSTTATAISSSPSTSSCRVHPACWNYEEKNKNDASKDLKQLCHGWPELVNVMVENPGFEAFQAFRDLNIKSLLYYQAELVQLRKELHALEWEDHRKGGDSARLCSNVRSLLLTKKRPEAQDQLKKLKEIREVLKEYNAALLQYAKMSELPEAETFNVKSLRTWIEMHITDDINITGPGRDSWGTVGKAQKSTASKSLWRQFFGLIGSIFWEGKSEEEDLDLVVPHRARDIDSLTRWVAGHGTPFWHDLSNSFKGTKTYEVVAPFYRLLCIPFRHKKRDEEKGGIFAHDRTHSNASTLSIFKRWKLFQQQVAAEQRKEAKVASLSTYSVNAMIRFTNHVATVVACLFPIIAIVVLSKIHTQAKILGFIALFTAVFAIGLMILTDSGTSRTEIFTATAAFAAVLVVFVQNQNPGGGG